MVDVNPEAVRTWDATVAASAIAPIEAARDGLEQLISALATLNEEGHLEGWELETAALAVADLWVARNTLEQFVKEGGSNA